MNPYDIIPTLVLRTAICGAIGLFLMSASAFASLATGYNNPLVRFVFSLN